VNAMARVDVERETGRIVLRISGEVDISNAREVSATLEAAVPNAADVLVVDLSGTTYLDSSGVQLLFELAHRVQARRQELRVVVPEGAPIRTVLDLTGLPKVVRVDRR
jgi:anti-anti-sigma factor